MPVASIEEDAPAGVVEEVERRWADLGHELYIVGVAGAYLNGSRLVAESRFAFTLTERTIVRRPNRLIESGFSWGLGAASDASGDALEAWSLEIVTTWTPVDSSSIIGSEGLKGSGRWWLEYRPTGLLEYWVNTDSGPVGVAYPIPLDDGKLRTIPFGIYGEAIFIGYGADRASAAAPNIVPESGPIVMERTYDGLYGNWRFVGEAKIQVDGSK